MSKEEGDFYRRIKKQSQEKRWSNNEKSLKILEEKGIEYEVLNSSIGHYRIGDFDFWATTGKFYNRKLKKAGRGVFNLIRFINQYYFEQEQEEYLKNEVRKEVLAQE